MIIYIYKITNPLREFYQVELHQVPHRPRVRCDQAICSDRQSPLYPGRYREVDVKTYTTFPIADTSRPPIPCSTHLV